MKNPPQPLPDHLWGDRWRFAALAASEIADAFSDRAPIVVMPPDFLPLQLGLASTVLVPGVVIDGGRRSLPLARWLQTAQPEALTYIPGPPDGLILAAGTVDRWIVATFEDDEVKAAGVEFEHRKQLSQGLHFLLVQPDDSGMTYTGFWLLRESIGSGKV
jgi:RNA-binding protein Tab2/Atab2